MRIERVEPARSPYAAFPETVDRDWVGRWCHLSEADLGLVRRHRSNTTRLGFATQLVTVRAIGTFLSDPAEVPKPVVDSVASQLGIEDPALLIAYSKMPVRWRHSTDIRERYGYQDFNDAHTASSSLIASSCLVTGCSSGRSVRCANDRPVDSGLESVRS